MPIPIRVSHNYSPLIFFAILKIPPVVRKMRKIAQNAEFWSLGNAEIRI